MIIKHIKYKFTEKDKVWFTADTHFWHDKILQYCNRPFKNIEEMNVTLIKNWNSKVGKDDYVFHLGDFAFGSQQNWISISNLLNGHLILIKGNHDENTVKGVDSFHKFEYVTSQMTISVCGQKIYLNHYPFLCYAGTYRSSNSVWQLFGHVHSSPYNKGNADTERLKMLFPYQYDVGVDNNGFAPISFDELKIKIERQIYENEKRKTQA